MSDDDEYYEWEEEYLFEDPVPDLVDELAATSHYEAGLWEDPKVDIEDYFSDWDYYSDDYYDDDPTVKQGSLRAKTNPAAQHKSPNKARRAHAAPRVPNPPLNIDIASFQGVVWKTASLDMDNVAVQIYEPGQLEKVALLEDWREIFKSAQPALDKSRLRKKWTSGQSQVSASDQSVADDESLGDDEREDYEDNEEDDEMSDVVSTDQMDGSVDTGEVSNTTPELGHSPKEACGIAVEIPVKRGRKRKAEAPAKDTKTNKPEPVKSRSKRVALDKSDEDRGASGPVRRSTRQKK